MLAILFFKPWFVRTLWNSHLFVSFEECLERFQKSISFNAISEDWVLETDNFYGEMACSMGLYGINDKKSSISWSNQPWLVTGALSSQVRIRIPSSIFPAILPLSKVTRRKFIVFLKIVAMETPMFTDLNMNFNEVCKYLSAPKGIFMNCLPIDTKH